FNVFSTALTAPHVAISGLTLSAGNGTNGGAVYAHDIDLVLQDVVLDSNNAQLGGALYASSSSVTLSNATIQTNTATNGGGFFLLSGTSAQVTNSTISSNTASVCCGGAYIGHFGNATIALSNFTNNHALNGNGGGIAAYYTPLQITDGMISNNTVAGI